MERVNNIKFYLDHYQDINACDFTQPYGVEGTFTSQTEGKCVVYPLHISYIATRIDKAHGKAAFGWVTFGHVKTTGKNLSIVQSR
jgi:hypothetical protein